MVIHNSLTHWDRMTHVCLSKLANIGSDNGLSPGPRQAIIWANAGIWLIRTLGTIFSEILSEIHTYSFKKMYLKMSSAKWRQFCLNLNVLTLETGSRGCPCRYMEFNIWYNTPGLQDNWLKVWDIYLHVILVSCAKLSKGHVFSTTSLKSSIKTSKSIGPKTETCTPITNLTQPLLTVDILTLCVWFVKYEHTMSRASHEPPQACNLQKAVICVASNQTLCSNRRRANQHTCAYRVPVVVLYKSSISPVKTWWHPCVLRNAELARQGMFKVTLWFSNILGRECSMLDGR